MALKKLFISIFYIVLTLFIILFMWGICSLATEGRIVRKSCMEVLFFDNSDEDDNESYSYTGTTITKPETINSYQ